MSNTFNRSSISSRKFVQPLSEFIKIIQIIMKAMSMLLKQTPKKISETVTRTEKNWVNELPEVNNLGAGIS